MRVAVDSQLLWSILHLYTRKFSTDTGLWFRLLLLRLVSDREMSTYCQPGGLYDPPWNLLRLEHLLPSCQFNNYHVQRGHLKTTSALRSVYQYLYFNSINFVLCTFLVFYLSFYWIKVLINYVFAYYIYILECHSDSLLLKGTTISDLWDTLSWKHLLPESYNYNGRNIVSGIRHGRYTVIIMEISHTLVIESISPIKNIYRRSMH